jgi:hypothetical protein
VPARGPPVFGAYDDVAHPTWVLCVVL